jgi:hypothetical protein
MRSNRSSMTARIMAAGIAVGVGTTGAVAACGTPGPGTCHEEFSDLVAVTADRRDGFAALGSLTYPEGPGLGTALLRIHADNETEIVVVAPPDDPDPNDGFDLRRTEGRDLVRLPNGDFLVVGLAVFAAGEAQKIDGWVALLTPDGAPRWSRAYPGQDGWDQILQSGVEMLNGTLAVVGRQQTGPGDPQCSNASVASALVLNSFLGDPTGEPNLATAENFGSDKGRAAYYSIAQAADGSLFFTGFVSMPRPDDPSLCQDDIMALWVGGGQFGTAVFGSPEGDDLGYDAAFVDGNVLVGALGYDGVYEGQVLLLPPQRGDVLLWNAFPEGNGGRDRFLAITQDPIEQDILAVGSWSETDDARNKAWWYAFDRELAATDGGPITDYPGSSLNGVAVLPNGKALAVGYVRQSEGLEQFGWSLVIRQPISSRMRFTEKIRPVDEFALALADLPQEDGAYVVGAVSGDPSWFRLDGLASGDSVKVALDAPGGSALRVAAHTAAEGNVALVLTDADGSLVDFSNYRGWATELLERPDASGRYYLEVIAQSDVPSLDLELFAAPAAATAENAGRSELTTPERLMLGRILEEGGYFPGSEVEVGVSPETIRAFMAVQNARGEAVDGVMTGSEIVAEMPQAPSPSLDPE